jgi:hypothetical protein
MGKADRRGSGGCRSLGIGQFEADPDLVEAILQRVSRLIGPGGSAQDAREDNQGGCPKEHLFDLRWTAAALYRLVIT